MRFVFILSVSPIALSGPALAEGFLVHLNEDGRRMWEALLRSEDDGAASLIFADWLDENAGGQADTDRAALIRAQVKARDASTKAEERGELELRAQALIRANLATWLPNLPVTPEGVRFMDGIPRHVVLDISRRIPAGTFDRLTSLGTTSLGLRFAEADAPPDSNADSARRGRSELRRLFRTAAFRRFARNARVLDLRIVPANGAAFQDLLALEWPALESLVLRSCGIGAAEMTALVEWDGLARIRHLDLSGNRPGPDGETAVRALLATSRLGTVETLDLRNITTTAPTVRLVAARADSLQRLRRLVLHHASWPAGQDARMAALLPSRIEPVFHAWQHRGEDFCGEVLHFFVQASSTGR